LHKLDALAKYYDGVPRGAQTWEVPLHTPDILASAELVQCYVLGYQMTGRRAYLDQARYWAWTGLPFVYLILPVDGAVGAYATIAVFGATNWQAPNWMGMPVQWCGLVYADALYDLAELDPSGPWRRVADGIAASGIRQSFPKGDDKLYGLLPDSFNLRPQTRNGVAINPGTVQNVAARLFGLTPVYDMRAFRGRGVYVHAPGRIIEPAETTDCVSFEVDGWPPEPYFVLLAGLKGARSIFVNGAEVVGTPTCSESEGCAVIRVEGHCRVRVSW
jgi:hypothetical protein